VSEAVKILLQAESQFARSNYDEAIVLYNKALALDPKLYEAALHNGDAYVAKQDWDNAEKMYQKAIAIEPRRETAYRYSATPFMRQKKFEQARDRYIEALIAEPYSDMSPRGISQWANVTGVKLGHPEVKFPPAAEKSDKATEKKDDPVTKAWDAYRSVRAEWQKSKFAAAFPAEQTYRHSLKEETDAIRTALRSAGEKQAGNTDLQMLQKLEDAGLLESFVLLANPDEGIARDYAAYWADNRPKLRLYVLNFVIQK
jgi:tetratricopeptide (TPR) repeat protein